MITDWAGYVSLGFTVVSVGFWCFLNVRIWQSYKRAMIAHERFMIGMQRAQAQLDAASRGDIDQLMKYYMMGNREDDATVKH